MDHLKCNIIKTLTVLVLSVVLFGCAAQKIDLHPDQPQKPNRVHENTDYVIYPGDKLEIKFFYNPELNDTVQVRPDGKISLQLVDDVKAAGMTTTELDKELTEKYSMEFINPTISVIVRSFTGEKIYVGGEVTRQGSIDFTAGMTALQAVYAAQGFRETAKPEKAIVIRKNRQNRPMPIPVDLTAIDQINRGAVFVLQPQDVVYVPKSAIAKLNKFVKQYISDLLLFTGFGFSFEYTVEDGID